MSNIAIDFVVPWVDDSDPVWREKKIKYTGAKMQDGNTAARYRDWDTLKYWFRGIEKFAPWVRCVYFITDEQKPDWLNVNHPKLKWVKHTDYIPKEYLPTFSSHVIEWNLHRIEGLSEHFVYFNDDVFMIRETQPEDFFVDGIPCDYPQLNSISPCGFFTHIMFNNYELIKRHFSIKESIKQNPMDWIRAQKLSFLAKLMLFGTADMHLRVRDWHLEIAYNKSSFQKLWEEEYEAIHKTCQHKTRALDDVSSWCVREWRMLSNEFSFQKPRGQYFMTSSLSKNNDLIDYIIKQKGKTVCVNDTEEEQDFELHKQMIVEAFEKLLPGKSSFEL